MRNTSRRQSSSAFPLAMGLMAFTTIFVLFLLALDGPTPQGQQTATLSPAQIFNLAWCDKYMKDHPEESAKVIEFEEGNHIPLRGDQKKAANQRATENADFFEVWDAHGQKQLGVYCISRIAPIPTPSPTPAGRPA